MLLVLFVDNSGFWRSIVVALLHVLQTNCCPSPLHAAAIPIAAPLPNVAGHIEKPVMMSVLHVMTSQDRAAPLHEWPRATTRRGQVCEVGAIQVTHVII